MKQHISLSAPAKVNLHLDIKQKRADGFHDLISIFQKIDLFDEITIDCQEGDVFSCLIEDGQDIPMKKNTMYQAAKLFSEEIARPLDIRISCLKRIPSTGGLGGGSSDAATVLMGLNRLFDGVLDSGRLFEIGSIIGSDVPFFLGTSAAIVTGRGEFVQPIAARDDLAGLLFMPSFGVSTPEAFSLLDNRREQIPDEHQSLTPRELGSLYLEPVGDWRFFNSFEPVLFDKYPEYRRYIAVLNDAGYRFSTVSGSGSSFIAISDCPDISNNSMKDIQLPDNVLVRPIKMLADEVKEVYNEL